MTTKKIEIDVNDVDYSSLCFLTQEERLIAIKSGTVCLQECKSRMAEVNNAEVYKEIEGQFFDRFSLLSEEKKRLEQEVMIERELREREKKMYDERLEDEIGRVVRHKIEVLDRLTTEKSQEALRLAEIIRLRDNELFELKEKMRMQMANFDVKVQREVAIIGEKMNSALERNSQVLESVNAKTATKTSSEIGAIGEQCFYDVAKATFGDFDGFDIEDVHNQPHKGDFLLSLRGMTIMVDSKYYKRNVDNPQIDKIKSDLRRNTNIRFAWLVSLYSDIDKRDKATFMFEWITDEQCVVHINRLMLMENREAVLKSVFYLCQDYDKRISSRSTGSDELVEIKNSYFKVAERVGEMRKRMRELKAVIVSTRSLYDLLEKDIVNLMNNESNDINVKHHGSVSGWFTEKTKKNTEGCIRSTVIWNMFKREQPQISQDMGVGKFKEILITVVGEENIFYPKGKTGGMFEVKGIEWVDDVQTKNIVKPDPSQQILKVKTEKVES